MKVSFTVLPAPSATRSSSAWTPGSATPVTIAAAHGPVRRFALKRALGDRDDRGIIRVPRERHRPADVLEQQQKVANADALAFIPGRRPH